MISCFTSSLNFEAITLMLNWLSSFIKAQAVALVLLLTILLIVLALNNFLPFFGLSAFIPPPVVRSQSSQTIVQRVQPLGQLVTYSMPQVKANIEVTLEYGLVDICRISAFHVAQGTIEAGIDLQKLMPDAITYDEEADTYTIQLPPAELTECTIDPFETQQYLTQGETVVCPANLDELRRIASYEALIDFRNTALALDILGEAEQQARLVLGNFVEGITDSQVVIEFAHQADDISEFVASCNPQPIEGWVYREDDGTWWREK
jgi:hypothetical protein